MDLSLHRKNLILILVTVFLISGGSILYFIGVISNLQDSHYESHAKELAEIVSINIDIDTVKRFKDQVSLAYDARSEHLTNDYMDTPQYEAYMQDYAYLVQSSEFKELYEDLRALVGITHVDCFYLFYVDVPTQAVVYMVDSGDNNICHPGSSDHLVGNDLRVLNDPDISLSDSITNSDIYGDVVGSGQPIYDEDGEVVAYVGVDISMTEVTAKQRRLLLNTILAIVLISVILLAISLYMSGLLLIKPINAHQRLVTESENLKKENIELENKARAAEKIAELTGSIQALLTHMPALTFSKDAENGKYVACNQMFAEYANKKSPSEVVGLTDEELFDHDTAMHFIEDDKVALNMSKPHIFREDVPDAAGNMKYLQTTKIKFTDANGRLCILGMAVDISELIQVKNENVKAKDAYDQAVSEKLTYSSIASALSADYSSMYYVNIVNDRFREYSAMDSQLELSEEDAGENFFEQSLIDIKKRLYFEDQARVSKSFYKDNILKTIDEEGSFGLTYRLIQDDEPVYVELKAVRLQGDDEHIIIAVHNIDAQMRDKEAAERMKEERITYERIAALSGQYICIYTVDPETDHFVEYASTSSYKDLTLPKEGEHFFERTRVETAVIIYDDDRQMFMDAFSKENILKEIERGSIYSIKYRIMINGKPTYVRLKAAMISEKDGPQIIVGLSDIDERVKIEQEYADNLAVAQNKANYDELTGLMNKHSYVEAEIIINEAIDSGEPCDFAIVVCDVNGLKQVNDTLGHKAGDELLIKAGRMITEIFSEGRVYRIGGDEFAVIIKNEGLDHIDKMMGSMNEKNRYNLKNKGIVIACGLARYESTDRNMDKVFERADRAMYENKQMLKGEE